MRPIDRRVWSHSQGVLHPALLCSKASTFSASSFETVLPGVSGLFPADVCELERRQLLHLLCVKKICNGCVKDCFAVHCKKLQWCHQAWMCWLKICFRFSLALWEFVESWFESDLYSFWTHSSLQCLVLPRFIHLHNHLVWGIVAFSTFIFPLSLKACSCHKIT